MRGTVPPLPNMSSWRAQGNFVFTPGNSDCRKHSVVTSGRQVPMFRSVLQPRLMSVKMLPLDIGSDNCLKLFKVLFNDPVHQRD
jgi:hypothetical protein